MKKIKLSRSPVGHIAAFIALSAASIALVLPSRAAVEVSFIDLNPSGATASAIRVITATRQGGWATYDVTNNHAGVWSGTADSFVDLHPSSGPYNSYICALGETTQAGYAMYRVSGVPVSHPALWFGSASSFQDLDAGDQYSGAIWGGDDAHQVGEYPSSTNGNVVHAVLWSDASSRVDLHPTGARSSGLRGLGGAQQAGWANFSGYNHAALWQGTAGSFVDLHPVGASSSVAYGTTDTQQAGYAIFSGVSHAALWSGTAASFIDLHPVGASSSTAQAISGTEQAGHATIGGVQHAILWSGTADSFLDLHSALGGGYSSSDAYAIYSGGATTYVGGSAGSHAILWTIRSIPGTPLLISAKPRIGTTNVVTLTWTNAEVPCNVESAPALTGTWSTVSSPWTTNGTWVSTTVSNTASAQFFRLRN